MNYSHQEIKRKKNQFTQTSQSPRYRIKKYSGYIGAIIVVAFIFVCIIGAAKIVRGLASHAPKVQEMDLLSKGNASVMYDIAGKEIQKLDASDIDSEYVTIANIPKSVQQAFVAIEDRYFYQHHGVDMTGFLQSVYAELTENSQTTQTSSTITQQLIENQIMESKKEFSMMEKASGEITEQLLAVDLENSLSKEEILEYYLNTINLGDGVVGVQAASQRYFDKDVTDLNISEAAVLASVVIDPAQYEPEKHSDNNAEKRKIVLKNMLEDGYISEDEYEDALGDDVYLRIQKVGTVKINRKDKLNSYYTDATADQIISDMKSRLGYTQTQAYNALYRGGLKIYTCQDSSIQQICDTVINDDRFYPPLTKSYLTYSLVIAKDGVSKEYSEIDVKNYILDSRDKNISLYFKDSKKAQKYVKAFRSHMLNKGGVLVSEDFQLVKQPQVSFVLLEQATGRVKAIVGGRGKRLANRAINRATEDTRQPGSAFGILSSYLPALDTAGMTLGTVQPNGQNEGTTLRNSILDTDSSSTTILEKISVRTGYEYLKKLGFSTIVEQKKNENGNIDSDLQLDLAKGELTDGVTNLELTAAYAAIANRGVYQRPRFYTKVVDGNGKILLENNIDSTRVMKESSAWLLTDAMQDVVNTGAAKKVSFSNFQMEQAGQIGNTKEKTDFWFEGFTPYYTAGIWTGQDEKTSEENADYHLTIWKEIMEQVHAQKKLHGGQFNQPEDIISCVICTRCGKVAVDGVCSKALGKKNTKIEYYTAGTQPVEKCNCHAKYHICKKSGKLAGENCPKKDVYEKIFELPVFSSGSSDSDIEEENGVPKEFCELHNQKE